MSPLLQDVPFGRQGQELVDPSGFLKVGYDRANGRRLEAQELRNLVESHAVGAVKVEDLEPILETEHMILLVRELWFHLFLYLNALALNWQRLLFHKEILR